VVGGFRFAGPHRVFRPLLSNGGVDRVRRGVDMSFNLSCIIREAGVSTPDKPVAYHVGGTLTFRELDEQSDRLAAGLHDAGVVPGNAVGLQLPNLAEFLVPISAS